MRNMINLGIIGTNWITQQFVEAARESGDYTLNAVYSRHIETAKQFAKKNNAKEVFDDLDQFLQRGHLIRSMSHRQIVFILSRQSKLLFIRKT